MAGKMAMLYADCANEVQRSPGNLAGLATAYWQCRKRQRAVELAEEALSKLPTDPAVMVMAGRILFAADRQRSLKGHLLQLAKQTYDLPQYYGAIAQGLVAAGALRKALGVARRAAREYPESADVACVTSQILLDAEAWNDASRLLRRLLKLDPAGHGKFALMNLTYIGTRTGDFESLTRYALQAAREYDDPSTRRVLKRALASITGAIKAREAAVETLSNELATTIAEHDTLRTKMAGYDLTEGGTQLEYALAEGENWHIEFMRKMPDQVRDLAKEIAAMSSQDEGGTIFLGVDDDKAVVGVHDAATETGRDLWRSRVRNLATKAVAPPNPVTLFFHEMAGRIVVKIWVPSGNSPIYYVDKIPYVRNLDESRPALPEEVEEHIARRSKHS
jgi:tetratricopeptide (TPR) repeat protein